MRVNVSAATSHVSVPRFAPDQPHSSSIIVRPYGWWQFVSRNAYHASTASRRLASPVSCHARHTPSSCSAQNTPWRVGILSAFCALRRVQSVSGSHGAGGFAYCEFFFNSSAAISAQARTLPLPVTRATSMQPAANVAPQPARRAISSFPYAHSIACFARVSPVAS